MEYDEYNEKSMLRGIRAIPSSATDTTYYKPIPTPSSISPAYEQVNADAGRTIGSNAKMFKKLLTTKAKFPCNWNYLDATTFNTFRNLGKDKNFFYLAYRDTDGTIKKDIEFYGGDLTGTVGYFDDDGNPRYYTNVSWSMIER